MVKLFKVVFIISGSLLPVHGNRRCTDSEVINFDDIETVKGIGFVPSSYHYLSFSNYNVLKPNDPSLEGKISPNDLNCAVSSPNALIGSRFTNDQQTIFDKPKGAYFKIANATALQNDGFFPYFTLKAFYVKALDAPPGDMKITVNGWTWDDEELLDWHVDIPSGYHTPFLVKMQEFSGRSWDHIVGVEILTNYGEDALDWEFCLDDLEIQFFEIPDQETPFQQSSNAEI